MFQLLVKIYALRLTIFRSVRSPSVNSVALLVRDDGRSIYTYRKKETLSSDRPRLANCWKCWELDTDMEFAICADTKLTSGCTIYVWIPVGN